MTNDILKSQFLLNIKWLRWTPFLLILAIITTLLTGSLVLGTLAAIGLFLLLTVTISFRAYSQNRMSRRKWFAISAVALIGLVALFQFLQYRPPLMAAPGFALQNITEPGWLNGRFKTFQTLTEQTPCTYTVLGWQEEASLFYEADCRLTNQVWRFDIATNTAEEITTAPFDLYANAVSKTDITDSVLADVYPRELTTVSREVYMVGDAFPSPNGRFTAFISRHIYGPQDILLLSSPTS